MMRKNEKTFFQKNKNQQFESKELTRQTKCHANESKNSNAKFQCNPHRRQLVLVVAVEAKTEKHSRGQVAARTSTKTRWRGDGDDIRSKTQLGANRLEFDCERVRMGFFQFESEKIRPNKETTTIFM
jgi:hypothetical protein